MSELTYTDDGDPMCVVCRDRQDLEQREHRLARTLRNLAYGSAVGGVVSLPFAWIFVLGGVPSVAAFGSSLRSFVLLRAATPKFRERLGIHHRLATMSAIIGLVTGVLGSVGLLVNLTFVFLRLATQRP